MAKLAKVNLKAAWKMKGTTAKNAFKRAWRIQKGKIRKTKKSKSSTTKKSKSKSKSSKKMGNNNRKRVIHIPLALGGGLLGSLSTKAPSGNSIIGRIKNGDIEGALYDAKEIYTGVDVNGQFQMSFLKKGWLPIIVGAGLHILATKLGINRALYNAQKGLPIKIGL